MIWITRFQFKKGWHTPHHDLLSMYYVSGNCRTTPFGKLISSWESRCLNIFHFNVGLILVENRLDATWMVDRLPQQFE